MTNQNDLTNTILRPILTIYSTTIITWYIIVSCDISIVVARPSATTPPVPDPQYIHSCSFKQFPKETYLNQVEIAASAGNNELYWTLCEYLVNI